MVRRSVLLMHRSALGFSRNIVRWRVDFFRFGRLQPYADPLNPQYTIGTDLSTPPVKKEDRYPRKRYRSEPTVSFPSVPP